MIELTVTSATPSTPRRAKRVPLRIDARPAGTLRGPGMSPRAGQPAGCGRDYTREHVLLVIVCLFVFMLVTSVGLTRLSVNRSVVPQPRSSRQSSARRSVSASG